MTKPNCKYYLMHKKNDKHVFYLDGKPYCDLLNCKNNKGTCFSFEVDGNLISGCSANMIIENGDPADKKGKIIDLEKIAEQGDLKRADLKRADFRAYSEVKITDLKTGKPQN